MVDRITPEQRSRLMARIRDRDTQPELVVRRLVHRMGFRYRLHAAALPGKPDVVLPRHHKVIFVHGCFWHRHRCRTGRHMPKSRVGYWTEKFRRNVERDRRARRRLRYAGWEVLIVWECQTRDREALSRRLRSFLE